MNSHQIFLYGAIAVLNVAVLLILYRPKAWSGLSRNQVLRSALISTAIVVMVGSAVDMGIPGSPHDALKLPLPLLYVANLLEAIMWLPVILLFVGGWSFVVSMLVVKLYSKIRKAFHVRQG